MHISSKLETLSNRTYKTGCYRWILRLSLILILICPIAANAQNLAFNHIGTENGLSNNSILGIAQDKAGFLWFATRFGLNRYDGLNFKIYTSANSSIPKITDNYILSVFCDSQKNLWVLTASGINKYNPVTDAFEHIEVSIIFNQKFNTINCIYEDRGHHLWVGTIDGLYQLVDNKLIVPPGYNKPLFKGYNIHTILNNHLNDLWIGTDKGLINWQAAAGNKPTVFSHSTSQKGSLSDNFVTSIVEDHEHDLWIGTQTGGINKYNSLTRSFTAIRTDNSSLRSNNIRKLMVDQRGKIWAGTLEGLSIIDPITNKVSSYQHSSSDKKSLSQNSIYSIYEDSMGSVWIGTYFGGANVVYAHNNDVFTVYQNNESKFSISNNVISSITEDHDKNLWVGTEGGGLNYLNRTNGLFYAYKNIPGNAKSLSSNLVKIVYCDKDGQIWIGTHGGGLNRFDTRKKIFSRYLFKENDPQTLTSEITALLDDSKGRFWVGTQLGARVFKRTGTALTALNVPPFSRNQLKTPIKALFEDSTHNIWIGSSLGLFMLPAGSEKFITLPISAHKSVPAYINCITEDQNKNIWIGLYYGGISMYDPITKQFTNYSGINGLPGDNVVGIVADTLHNIWLSTNNGLCKFNLQNKTFQIFTTSDGLAGNSFNNNAYYKSSNGKLYFGGFNGLTSFFPSQIEVNKNEASVVFTSLKLFNKPVEINSTEQLLPQNITITKHITFNYKQNVFTLEFALLNFIKSEKNKYAYKLEGFDKAWNFVNINAATYTNLTPGNYTLLVKGANNDGLWSKTSAIKITVLPPFWKTVWAYLLYLLILITILFFIVRFFFLRAILKRDHELHQIKLNFFTNISHEIRTHLALITGPVEALMMLNNDHPENKKQLKHIKKNSDSLLNLVSELMDFRKAETGHIKLNISLYNICSFVKEIYTSFEAVAQERNIKAVFNCPEYEIDFLFDCDQMEKVFFNLLSNAYKFTPADGQISVDINDDKNKVQIRITNNGKGIAPENLSKLFVNFYQENDYNTQNTGYGIGLALSKSIVEVHKGSLTVDSRPIGNQDKLTTFTVTLLKQPDLIKGKEVKKDVYQPQKKPLFIHHTENNIPVHAEVVNLEKNAHTVLVIEDHAELRKFISEVLRNNYQVIESADGLNGWEIAIELIPDLIVSDVMMPDMDGLTLCKKLKTDDRTSHIPIILLTALASQDQYMEGLGIGADIYMVKPFSIQILELQVRNLLALRSAMQKKFGQLAVIQPEEPVFANPVDDAFLKKLTGLVEKYMDNPQLSVSVISTEAGMSPPILYKKIKALTNMSVLDFIKHIRLKKATELLLKKELTIFEVAYAVGYTDRKYFSKDFKKQFNKTPTEFIQQATL